MKVSNVGSTRATGSVSGKKAVSGKRGDFAAALAEAMGVDDAAEVQEAQAVVGLDAVLAAQATGDATEEESKRQLMQRGHDILDRLEDIRRDLLLGLIPKDRLINLAQLLRTKRQQVSDPVLLELLDDIELRAEVEIAKLTRGG